MTRASDTLCRVGGDEFLYLAIDLTTPAGEVAERLLGVLAEPFLSASVGPEQSAGIGVVVDDVAGTTIVIERLRELGVTVALDDFSTGHSSLSYLARLRPNRPNSPTLHGFTASRLHGFTASRR